MTHTDGWDVVLFDFDGVLFDSKDAAIALVEEIRGTEPFDSLPSPSTEGNFGGLYRGVLRDALVRFGLDAEQSRAFFDRHAQGMRSKAEALSLFEGIADGIRDMDPLRFGIITSSYSDVVIDAFRRAGVEIDPTVVIGHEVRQTKTQKIEGALAARGLGPERAVYVGDMESDVLYCRSVPIRCIAVSYGYHPASILALADPYLVLGTPAELFQTLNKGFDS